MKIAVIGSGLAAVSAAEALIERGIIPIILDVGETLDSATAAVVKTLSQQSPDQWRSEDRELITRNPTVANKTTFPLKLAFGSDFFYGHSTAENPIRGEGGLPPLSFAKGGFSVGWGSSVMPPADCDLIDWPIKFSELGQYFDRALAGKPYSVADDGLSINFPTLTTSFNSLRLTPGNHSLLVDLRQAKLLAKDRLVFGQSRLMVRTKDDVNGTCCQYCGNCMSGCVYNALYKSSCTIEFLQSAGKIDYRPGHVVSTLMDDRDGVTVKGVTKAGENFELRFDRVFLAAGALNTTRIVLQSKKLYGKTVSLRSTVAFIAPMLRFKRSKLTWPNAFTLPGIILEYKARKVSGHWIHCQISTPNELVLQRLGLNVGQKGIITRIKTFLAEHLVLALGNLHSTHGNGYDIRLENDNGKNVLVYSRQNGDLSRVAIKEAVLELLRIGSKIKCFPLLPLVQNSIVSGGYHVGGSLPMKMVPIEETDTDVFGTPKGWHSVHVVDSSIFPSLPGTTIGLLSMANAFRIASEVPLRKSCTKTT